MLFGALLLQYAKMEGEDTFSLHFWQLHAHSPPSTKKKFKKNVGFMSSFGMPAY